MPAGQGWAPPALDLLEIHDAAVIAFSGETALAVDLGNGDRTGAKRGSVEGMLICPLGHR